MNYQGTIEQRLEKYSIPEPNTGCVLWFGYWDIGGYGRVKHNGKLRKAHIVAWELEKGPFPKGLVPDHLCRMRCCINPDHIEPVTQSVNVLRGINPGLLAARNRSRRGIKKSR